MARESNPSVAGHREQWPAGNVPGVIGVDGISASGVANLAYLASWQAGIEVIDVSRPQHPEWLARVGVDGRANGIELKDGLAFVATDEAGLQILDLRDPIHPTTVGRYHTNGRAVDIGLVDNWLFLNEDSRRLLILDVRDPTHPVWVGGVDNGSVISTFRVAEGLVFLAENWDGLSIHRFDPDAHLPRTRLDVPTVIGNDVWLQWSGGRPPYVVESWDAVGDPPILSNPTNERMMRIPVTSPQGIFRVRESR